MPRFFVKTEQINQPYIYIKNEDVNHIKNVLRKKVEDKIEVCNQETGDAYLCEIEQLDDNEILTKVIEKLNETETNIKIDIYQGLPKAEKMELIIQKSVELGVNSIIPVSLKRCVVKLEGKDQNKKIERWQKIAESAAKQCGRNIIPKIENIIKIKQFEELSKNYDSLIVAYENEKEYTLKQEIQKIKQSNKKELKIAVVIGPEGGLAEEEIETLKNYGANIVTLGKRILRTETVALNILSILMYELEM